MLIQSGILSGIVNAEGATSVGVCLILRCQLEANYWTAHHSLQKVVDWLNHVVTSVVEPG